MDEEEWVVYYIGRTNKTVAVPKSRWEGWWNKYRRKVLDDYKVKLTAEGLTEEQAKQFVKLTRSDEDDREVQV